MALPNRSHVTALITAASLVFATPILAVAEDTPPPSPNSASTTADSEHTTTPVEYGLMRGRLNLDIEEAEKRINAGYDEAVKMRKEHGSDAAFGAVERFDQARDLIKRMRGYIDEAGDEPTRKNTDLLLEARALLPDLTQRLEYAEYNLKLAKKLEEGKEENTFTCDNAIDEGDETGSSIGSSTLGIFDWIGNRVVYDKDGNPQCETNFKFFATKVITFLSTVTTVMGLIGTFARLAAPVKQG